MSNLFDATQAPEGEPLQIVAGDFVQWKVSNLVDDYPTDSYTLVYTARISGARDLLILIMLAVTSVAMRR